jgi:DNA-binding MarR family transcriptional regulator
MVIRVDDWSMARTVGLNPTQLAILSLLAGRDEGGLGVKEIAAHLGVSQPTATDSINALERKAYLEKLPGMNDKRAVRLALTGEGAAALQAARHDEGLAGHAIGALDDEEQEELLASLIKMIRHLQETDAIPLQRMCETCRYFAPFVHPDAARPHHCNFVDAAFGRRELRIDCRDHDQAGPTFQAGITGGGHV